MESCGNGGDLGGISHPKGRGNAKDAVHHRQAMEPPGKPPGDHVHGAAYEIPAPLHPVTACQGDLGKLGGHSQQSADPHPEYRPRPAQADGPGDTHNVPGAHGGGKGRTQRLERGDPLPLGLAPQDAVRPSQQGELREGRPDGQVCTSRQQEPRSQRPPQDIMEKQKRFRCDTPIE